MSTTDNSRDETASTSGTISMGGSAAPRAKALHKLLLDGLNRQMRLHPAPPERVLVQDEQPGVNLPPAQEHCDSGKRPEWAQEIIKDLKHNFSLIGRLEPPGITAPMDCANDEH